MVNNDIINLVNNELAGLGYLSELDSYELIYINKILAERLEVYDDSYKGKKCYEFIYGYDKPCEYCKLKFASYDDYYSWYYYNEKYNIHFSMKERLVELEDVKAHLVVSLDITGEVRKEEELLRLSSLDQVIISCVKEVINKQDTEVAINTILELVCNFYEGCRAYIFEIDHISKTRNCTYSYCVEGLPKLTEVARKLPFEFDSQWGNYLMNNSFFYTDEIDKAFDESDFDYGTLNGGGVTSMLNVPLYLGGALSGYIGVDNPDNFNGNAELLATIAAFILNIIDKHKNLAMLKSSKSRLDNTYEVGETLINCAKFLLEDTSNTDETDASIISILETVCAYYDCECAYIFEWDRETKKISNTYEHVWKTNSCVNDLYYISHELIDGWFDILEEKNIMLIRSCNEELDYSSEQYLLFASSGIESIVMVPLVRDDKIIGALGLDNLSKNVDKTDLLVTLSGFIMNYVQKRELIKELEFLSYTDKLSGLYNRNYYLSTIDDMKADLPKKLGIIFADVNGLKKANDKLGHEFGDILLKWCANFLKNNLDSLIFRIGGDEYVSFIRDIEQYDFDVCVNNMRDALKKMPHINMSIGSTWHDGDIDIDKQIIETDKMMYMEKQRYYAIVNERNLTPEQELEHLKSAILELKASLDDNSKN